VTGNEDVVIRASSDRSCCTQLYEAWHLLRSITQMRKAHLCVSRALKVNNGSRFYVPLRELNNHAITPPCWLRWITPIIWILVFLNFGGSMAATAQQGDTLSVRPFSARPSLDTNPVEVSMSGIRWRVPRNFLESAELYNRSEDRARRVYSAHLRIVTTVSTLKGATVQTLPCYKALRAEVCPDTIIILTQWMDVSPSVWNRAALLEAANDPRDDFYGLTKVNAQVSVGKQDVYVFYDGSFQTSTVISCSSGDRESLRDCSARLEIGNVPLRYTFAISQLPQWRRIQAGVVGLIKSFEAGAK
jgi:hypothetical protein